MVVRSPPPSIAAGVKRIALVTHGFATGGGVATVVRWLRDTFDSQDGYTVDVHDLATSSRDPVSRRMIAPRSWLRSSLKSSNDDQAAFTHWGANCVEVETMRYRPRRELRRSLNEYDVVHVVCGSPAWGAAVADVTVPVVLQPFSTVAWERSRPLADGRGAVNLWRRRMTSFTGKIERRALRDADTVLVPNVEMMDFVRAGEHRHVKIAHPGVDTIKFAPSTGGLRRDGYVLSVCRLADLRKGVERTIRAYAHIVDSDAFAPPLVLAGKGALPDSLTTLVADLGLTSRVTVRSDISSAELIDMYLGAALFMQTSFEEGLGMSVLEAMACGLPVVATDTAGTRETVADGLTGFLVSQESSTGVPRLVGDRALRILHGDGVGMGARGRERCVAMFSTDVSFRRFVNIYEELLVGARERSRAVNVA